MNSRKRLTRAKRHAILDAHGHRCAICGNEIDAGRPFELDHEIALSCGGNDSIDNLRPVHQSCHRRKTKADVKVAAKIKRIRKKRSGEWSKRNRRKIPSRKFRR